MERSEENINRLPEQPVQNEKTPENIARWARELEAYNDMQMQLALRLYPDITPEEAMMSWIENEKHYSERFRELVKNDAEINERVLRQDPTVIEEIEKRIYE
jgi:hypothetical protein